MPKHLDTLRGIPARVAKVRADYAAALRDAHNTDTDELGAAVRRRRFEQAATNANAALVALRDEAAAAAKAARTPSGKADAGNDSTRLLGELELQRAWTRLVRQLDAGKKVDDLIVTAQRDGDTAALRALRAELPAWADSADDAAMRAGITGRDDVPDVLGRVDEALTEVLPAGEADALRTLRGVDEAEPAATTALERAGQTVTDWTPDLEHAAPTPPSSLRKAWRYAEVEADGEVAAGPGEHSTDSGNDTGHLAADEVPHVGDAA